MKYEKPQLIMMGSAICAIQGMTKDITVQDHDNQSDDAYVSDEA